MRKNFLTYSFTLVGILIFLWPPHTEGNPLYKGDTLAVHYNNISRSFLSSDPDSAYFYAKIAIQFARKHHNHKEESNSLRYMGSSFLAQSQYKKALKHYQNALKTATLNNLEIEKSRALINIGLIHRDMGNYPTALSIFLQNLQINEKLGDLEGIVAATHNLALVYHDIKDYKNALYYMHKALEGSTELQNERIATLNLVNLAMIKRSLGQTEEAKDLLHQAVELANKEHKETRELGKAYFELGSTFYAEQDLEIAGIYIKKSLEIFKQLGNLKGEALAYNKLSCIHLESGHYQDALRLLKKGKALAHSIENKAVLMENYGLWARYYEQLGLYDKALNATKTQHHYQDSLFNEQMALSLESLHLEKAKEETKEVLAQKESELSQNRTAFYNLLIILVLIMFLTLAITSRYRVMKRVSKELKNKNEEILLKNKKIEDQHNILRLKNNELETAQKIIESQNLYLEEHNADLENKVKNRTQKLRSANQELETLIYRTSHDLKSPITSILGLVEVARLQVKDQFAHELFEKIKLSTLKQQSTLKELYDAAQIRLTSLHITAIDFNEQIQNAFAELKEVEGFEKVIMESDIKLDTDFYTDKYLLSLIFKQTFLNSIIYRNMAHKNSSLEVKVEGFNNGVSIIISDNGIGIEKGLVHKAFDLFFRANNRSTGNGLGLYLVKKAVEKLKGEVSMESQVFQGTKISIWLPTLCKPKVMDSIPFKKLNLN